MTETESKVMEVDTDDIIKGNIEPKESIPTDNESDNESDNKSNNKSDNKENVSPKKSKRKNTKKPKQKTRKKSKKSKKKKSTKSDNESKEKSENETETENTSDNKPDIDLSEYTEDILFADMQTFVKNEVLGSANTKKAYRSELEKKYNLPKRALKKYEPFDKAMITLTELLTAEEEAKEYREIEAKEQKEAEESGSKKKKKSKKKPKKKSDKSENETENDTNETSENETEKSAKKSSKKKDKKAKKNRKSRKRKRPDSEDENDNSDANAAKQPKKRRKKNNGSSANDESDTNNKKSKKKTKKTKKRAGQWTLDKLRKILRVTGLGSPKVYSKIKNESIKKQIEYLKNLLDENGIDYSVLSDKAIKKIKSEFELKREMMDLGINGTDIPQSEGRAKRKRKKVVYSERMDMTEILSGSEGERAMEDEQKEEMEGKGKESSDEEFKPDFENDDSEFEMENESGNDESD